MIDCFKWGSTGVMWFKANWKWPECGQLISAAISPLTGVDASTLIQPWLEQPWNPYRAGEIDKKKKLIKLICKVNGEIYEEEKEAGDMKISVEDINMIIKEMDKIDLDFKKLEEE